MPAPDLTPAEQATVDRFGIMPSTRPWTPDVIKPNGGRIVRVKRACNGCGSAIGDATDAEFDAAMNGLPLPDVRDECGCTDTSGGTR